jgi:hypothetical protein
MVLEVPAPVAPMDIFQQVICASDASAECCENILTFVLSSNTELYFTIIGNLLYYVKFYTSCLVFRM